MSYSTYSYDDPDSIKRRQAWAAEVMKAGGDMSPVQGGGSGASAGIQALARALQGLMGGYFTHNADETAKKNRAAYGEEFGKELKGYLGTSETPEGVDMATTNASPSRFDTQPTSGAVDVSSPDTVPNLPKGVPPSYGGSNTAAKSDMLRAPINLAQQQQESANNPAAVSPKGAQGLMQVMPDTAAQPGFGVQPAKYTTGTYNPKDPNDVAENIRVGDAYYNKLLQRYNGDQDAALVAYNGGYKLADKWMRTDKKMPLNKETANYVTKVKANLAAASGPAAAPAATDVKPNDQNDIAHLMTLAQNPWASDTQQKVLGTILAGKLQTPLERRKAIAEIQKLEAEAKKDPNETTLQKDYNWAVKNGFQGSPMDFIKEKQNKTNPANAITVRADTKRLNQYRDHADTARTMRQDIAQLRAMRADVGYEGVPGAGLIATASGVANSASGGYLGSGSGEAVRSKAAEMQLNFTTRTKGSISDKEMALFSTATPGLSVSDAGANHILDGWDAAAARQEEQANFMEAWLSQHGSLSGANQQWNRFVNENPIIVKDDTQGFTINQDNISNWDAYLDPSYKQGNAAAAAPTSAPAQPGMPSPEEALQELRRRGVIK